MLEERNKERKERRRDGEREEGRERERGNEREGRKEKWTYGFSELGLLIENNNIFVIYFAIYHPFYYALQKTSFFFKWL